MNYILKMTCEDRVRYITPNNKGRVNLTKSALYNSYEKVLAKYNKCANHEWYGKNAKFEIMTVSINEGDIIQANKYKK